MKFKSVIAAKRGGPEVLSIIEQELREPTAGEVRIKVLAVPVCLPDVQARYGQSPFAPPTPFIPGYAIIGTVDAAGPAIFTADEQIDRISVGDRVAALTVYGGYTEYIYLKKESLIPMPAVLDPADAAILVLNYIVAYQVLHRAAKVRKGQKVMIIGASGGIGTAFLQLGKLADLKMYGLASKSKHSVLVEYGAMPIDYHTQDFVEVFRQMEPDGIDVVVDGMGGEYFKRGLSILHKGGVFVEYGNTLSFPGLLLLLGKTIVNNLTPNGKTVKLYGTGLSTFNRKPFLDDWRVLFSMVASGKIKPVIEHRYPILEAPEANARLETGQVIGNLVLLSPELL